MKFLRRLSPVLVPLAFCLLTTRVAVAQSTSLFGYSCRINTSNCLDKNTQYTTDTTLPPTNSWIYLKVTAPSGGLTVSGFSLLLRSRTVPDVRVPTRLLAAAANGGPGTVLADGRPIYVDSTQRWCTTWFANRTFSSNEVFYIGYRNPGSEVSLGGTANTNGADVSWYHLNSNGVLSGRQTEKWKYQIVCGGGSPNPSAYTLPRIGTTFTWGIDSTPVSNPAIPFYGLSNTSGVIGGNHYSLPRDLTFLGAPQCDVLVSPEVFRPAYFQSTWRTDLVIPNVPSLMGFRLYGQWLVSTPGQNGLGYSLSNGLEITIG